MKKLNVARKMMLLGGLGSLEGKRLLDVITTATTALSLRKLVTTASNCIDVRRSSDDATATVLLEDRGSIKTSSKLLGKTERLAEWAGLDIIYVTKIYDQMNLGHDVVNTNVTYQGIIMDGGIMKEEDGDPIIEFAGAEDQPTGYVGSLDSSISYGNACSIFAVSGSDIGSASGTIFTSSVTSTRLEMNMHLSATPINSIIGTIRIAINLQALVPFGPLPGSSVLTDCISDGADYTFRRNNVLGSPVLTPESAYQNSRIWLGQRFNGNNSQKMRFKEFIIFSNQDDVVAIREALNKNYKLY